MNMRRYLAIPIVLAVFGFTAGVLLSDEPAPPPAKNGKHCGPGHHCAKIGLNLTDEQKAKVKEIRTDSRAKVHAVLTPEQLAKLDAVKGEGFKARREAWKEVRASLTDEQKASIKDIRKAGLEAFKAVLTPEQLEKLKAWHAAHATCTTKPAA
jgi:Spy/CpxP family protein refolding chaperone